MCLLFFGDFYFHILLATEEFIASPPSAIEVIGPFMAWSPPETFNGDMVRYDVKLTSDTGSYTIVEKDKMETYYLLEREDVPDDLGTSSPLAIQVILTHIPSDESNFNSCTYIYV